MASHGKRVDQSASMRGRIGAHRLHATHDPRITTAKARAVFESRWERDVDPEQVLDPQERARRADAARKAHFARLAYLSAKARAKRGKVKRDE
jgi:hypothetical protein